MSKHLVVGATSGLGRATAKSLLECGEEVRVLVRNMEKAEKYFSDLKGIEIISGDAAKPEDIASALKGVSVLFYCINVPYHHWESKAKNLLEISLQESIKADAKFVFPGNVYVYGKAQTITVREEHPHDAHTKKGKIRKDMERMLKIASEERGLNYTIVRMPDFYGPFVINGMYDKIFINALQGKPLHWYGKLDIPIEFIYIEDAGKAMSMAGLSDKSNGKEFNVPGSGITSPREFLNEVARQGWKESRIKASNSSLVVSLGGIFNPVAREFKEMMYLKRERFILDGTLFKQTFGYVPSTPYKTGINKTLRWVRHFYFDNALS